MRILVTGGAGFIGSHLTRRLLAGGHTVTVVDNLLTGSRESIPAGVDLLELDIGAPDALARLPATSLDAVLHLAAQSSGEISFERPDYDLLTNAFGTLNVLRWCTRTGTPRLLYASSMAVYGDVDEEPIGEEHPLHPKSFYGVSKLAGEGYVSLFTRQGLQTTILRMFNVYGPGQNLENMKQGMVSIYLSFVLGGQPLLVRGSARRFRDLIYVDDVVDAWLAALDSPASHSKTYNLGSGTRTYVSEIVEGVIRALGKDPQTYPVEYGEGTPGDQFGSWARIDRISSELGWRPKTLLADGLRQMAEDAVTRRART